MTRQNTTESSHLCWGHCFNITVIEKGTFFQITPKSPNKGSLAGLLKSLLMYDSFSDVGEIRVYFASKILTPCRMH